MQGLVAVIVTVHQAAVLLGLVAALVLGPLWFALFKNGGGGRRLAVAALVGVGVGLITFGVSAHLLHVAPLDLEVVSLD
ncbi:MAG: hypothetical protein HYS27_14840 [Deltaproteobacteria bacterium]|nr:hypothetical protein [Deltaproteobacteria bacterium]